MIIKNNIIMNKKFDYTEDLYHKKRHPEFFNDEVLYQAWSYFAWINYIKPFVPSSVLEVGGALGWNLSYCVQQGIKCEMVEPSKIGRDSAHERGIKTYDNLKDVPSCKFDLVLIRHVLEHVENPFGTLLDIKKYLHKFSVLEIVLPVENPRKMPNPNDLDHHLFCWNPQTIYNLLTLAGFHIKEISFNFFTGRRVFLPFWIWGAPNVYVKLIRILGRVLNASELVVIVNLKTAEDE